MLLVNLGTPEAPTPAAVRKFLKEFLSDRRVVEIPRFLWWPILHGLILPARSRASAARYASIWSKDGSPLRVHTERQANLLSGYWGDMKGEPAVFEYAMRYGRPGIREALGRLHDAGAKRILVLPLYPQFASSTTASVADELDRFTRATRKPPALRLVGQFHSHPAYVGALASLVRDHWEIEGRCEKLVLSFHGIPRRSVDRGDPYADQCGVTARLLARALDLRDDEWQMTFQSRFGRAEWLRPYTAEVLRDMGRAGVVRADVLCPGFVSDCLETLEEIGIDAKGRFLGGGGKIFHALPCLNERNDWIKALCAIVRDNLDGWARAA